MHVYFLIDRSGSMQGRWDETLGAVNGYVSSLSEGGDIAGMRVSVAFFDGNEPFALVRDDKALKKWKPLTDADATPRGMTPLFDAIGQLSALVAEDAPEKATVVVVTDGNENSSTEMNAKTAKAAFDRMRKQGFDVVFLGADFDAFDQAASVGTSREHTLNMTEDNYAPAMAVLSKRTRSYAANGKVESFSEADRAAARGE